mmetsp:Transcript_9057/g.29752  ORF Transcript_9057/g.29752 Transcript_9057/m.29752 type:complete len:274 (+) Transcript_9057:154-975(+)
MTSVTRRQMYDATAVYATVKSAAPSWIMVCFIMGTSLKPPKKGCAKTPRAIVPTKPPTPWTPNTSSESSYLKVFLMVVEKTRQMMPLQMPMRRAPTGPTNPAAGVTAARPATAPVQMPTSETLPVSARSWSVHTAAATDADTWVATHAKAASAPATTAEPPLNPNHPTQSIPVPRQVRTRLLHAISFFSRGPHLMAATSAPMPAVMCTTMPPAKSKTPMSAKRPPGPAQTMCTNGKYTANDHRAMYHITAENFMRSTKAPIISAGVMTAKVIW